jgi:hypothetical protein
MLKKTEKFSLLFRSRQNIASVEKEKYVEERRVEDEPQLTQCYSVTTGKVSTLVRSPSFSTVSTHSSFSFDGDGDDESDQLFSTTNVPNKFSTSVPNNLPLVLNNVSLVTNKFSSTGEEDPSACEQVPDLLPEFIVFFSEKKYMFHFLQVYKSGICSIELVLPGSGSSHSLHRIHVEDIQDYHFVGIDEKLDSGPDSSKLGHHQYQPKWGLVR